MDRERDRPGTDLQRDLLLSPADLDHEVARQRRRLEDLVAGDQQAFCPRELEAGLDQRLPAVGGADPTFRAGKLDTAQGVARRIGISALERLTQALKNSAAFSAQAVGSGGTGGSSSCW